MAQTTGPGSRTNGDTSASNGATGGDGTRRGFSLSGLFAPRQAGGANGATAGSQRPSAGMGSFLKGWLLLVVGMYVLQILLYVVDANLFHGWLETHYLAGTHGGTKPGSAFIVGGTSWYLLIFVALFAGLYYALVRLKVLPKDLFGQRSQATARAARDGRDAGTTARAGTTTRTSPPPLPSGVNPYANRTRAARREAQRRLALAAATPQPKRGLFGRSKPAVSAATATATAAVTTKKPARAAESAPAANAASPGDSHYQRVRAEQRQRKRRAAKR